MNPVAIVILPVVGTIVVLVILTDNFSTQKPPARGQQRPAMTPAMTMTTANPDLPVATSA